MQYFSKSFTRALLSMHLGHFGRWVQVYNRNFADLPEVWMKLDKGKGGRAMITRGWTDVVAKFGMKAGDIYLFWFCRGLHGGLKQAIKKVW
jgi:hypothetical protein